MFRHRENSRSCFFSVAQCLRGESIFEYNALVMIAKELLEILVCPACKQALEYRENPESLKCKQCHRVYAVKDDIPIMLVDEAKIEDLRSSLRDPSNRRILCLPDADFSRSVHNPDTFRSVPFSDRW